VLKSKTCCSKTTITVTPPNTTTSIPIATIHKQNTTSITASDNITTQAKSIVMNQSPPITKPILHSNVTINTNSVSSNLNEEDSSNSLHQKGKQNLFIPPKLTNTNTKPPQPKIDTVPAPKKGINILKKSRPFDMSTMRKATSEPALPIREDYADKYAKLLAMKKAREEKAKQNSEIQKSDRNDFFQELIKKEEEEKKKQDPTQLIEHSVMESNGSTANQVENGQNQIVQNSTTDSQPNQSQQLIGDKTIINTQQNSNIQSARESRSSSFSKEDEEQFLRKLGWRPEEEEKIPLLTQEEIIQVRHFEKRST